MDNVYVTFEVLLVGRYKILWLCEPDVWYALGLVPEEANQKQAHLDGKCRPDATHVAFDQVVLQMTNSNIRQCDMVVLCGLWYWCSVVVSKFG